MILFYYFCYFWALLSVLTALLEGICLQIQVDCFCIFSLFLNYSWSFFSNSSNTEFTKQLHSFLTLADVQSPDKNQTQTIPETPSGDVFFFVH